MEASAAPVPLRLETPAPPNGHQVTERAPTEAAPPLTEATMSDGTTRERVFEPIELPETHLLSGATIAALAALAGVAAIALGTWAFVSSVRDQDGGETAVPSTPIYGAAQAISLLSRPSTERIPLAGSQGSAVLAVDRRGRGVLVLDGLPVVPAGKSYQAWVVDPRKRPLDHESAAVFTGVETIVPLAQPVPRGWVLGVTVEREGGVSTPTRQFRIGAQRPR